MWHAALKSLLARKLRLLLTAIAIVLGVGFVSGTLVLTDTALAAFDDLFGDIFARTDVVVQAENAFDDIGAGGGGGGAQERDPIPEEVLPDVEAIPDVAAANGSVGGFAQVIDPRSDEVISGGGAPTIGTSWDPDVSAFELTGEPPGERDEVVIDSDTVQEAGLEVGDEVRIVTSVGVDAYRLSGVIELPSGTTIGGATVAAFDLEAAQRLFDREGEFDQIYVVARDGASAAAVARQIQAVLPDGFQAITATDAAAEQTEQVREGLGFLRTALLVFAFVALFVGAFVIFNTFNIVVTQRTRELGLLRALGASRRQVFGSVLLESLVIGLIGAGVGLAAGIGLAVLLKQGLAAIGLELPPTPLEIRPTTIVAALLVGVVVTVVASVFPARRASRVAPIEALREGGTGVHASLIVRSIVGGVLAVLGLGLLAVGLFADVPQPAAVVGGGAMLVFIGVAVLTPLFARPLAAAIGRPARRLGMTGRLGQENSKRNPRRTASTAAALMIGLGLVVFVSVFMTTLKASASETLDETLRADFILSASGFQPFSPSIARELSEQDEFSAVSPFRQAGVRIGGGLTFIAGVDETTIEQVVSVPMEEGSPSALARPETILLYKGIALARDLGVGDELPVSFARTGTQRLEIVGIYTDNRLLGDYTMSLDEYEEHVAEQLDYLVFVRRADGVPLERARTVLEEVAGEFPNIEINDQAQFKEEQNRLIDQVFGIVLVLLVLSVIISSFGIANTLALSIYERIRELGLLRAVGMQRRQLGWMIVIEAVIVSLLGALLGIAIGILFGWAMQLALADLGVSAFAVPWGLLVVFAIVAALLGLVASIAPAIRASRIRVLDAISYE
ncbi:MAG TPA: FtsX-like permease family protein [Actinomycetota bacterium]|nr:FtsX-like permease family protein [Actinomycetota bacterium]